MLLQDLGGKSPFEALLIYTTPLAPNRTRVVRRIVQRCLLLCSSTSYLRLLSCTRHGR